MVPRIAITTLGCKTNQYESAAMAEKLAAEGFPVVPFDKLADIYVVNTCTVTARTDAESRRLIRRIMKRNPAARVIVTGCYAQVSPDELEKMAGVTLVIGNSEKRDITRYIRELGSGRKVAVSDISREKSAEAFPLESFAEHTRAFLQIQNGCDSFCSYCIVPYARGRSRSVAPEDALAGIAAFSAKGYQEVVLTGIHLSGYGHDLSPPTSLLHLLRSVEERQLTPRLRLGSLEPMEIDDELIESVARSKIICPHIHIPLQSGADRVLMRMNRRYSSSYFRELIDKMFRSIPDLCVGLDLIAGFPGETDEEFEEGYRFVESLPVAYLHVFPFSSRPGTPAAAMNAQLSPSLIRERAQALRHLSDIKKQEYYRKFLGRELPVLLQNRENNGWLKGLSRNYIPVRIQSAAPPPMSELSVRIVETGREWVEGASNSLTPA